MGRGHASRGSIRAGRADLFAEQLESRSVIGLAMKMKLDSETANRLFYGLGILVLVFHFFHLSIYLVDIPTMDEWGGASFYPGLQTPELNWNFILAPHNMHRIVPTKLEYWLLQHYADLNFATLALINFFVFGLLSFSFLRALERRFSTPMGHFLVIFATTAMHENHFWGFGGQFHFCLGFYFLAVHAAVCDSAYRWSSLLWIAAAMLSFASGVAYAGSLVLLFLCLAWIRRRPIEYSMLAVSTATMMGLWILSGPAVEAEFTTPTSARFWDYFLNLLASGFGYTTRNLMPGAAILATAAGSAALLAWTLSRESAKLRSNVAGLLSLAFGLIAGLVSTSMGRAHMNSPKTSRYVELGIFLIPILWLIVRLALKGEPRSSGSRLATNVGLIALAIALIAPFASTYDYKSVYKPMFRQKHVTAACVRRYLFYGGDKTCPIPYWRDITKHMNAAKQAGLLYTDKP